MTTRMFDEELAKYRILSARFLDHLWVNEFISDLIKKWLKTFTTNQNIYSAHKITTIYPFNEQMTERFLLTIQNIIYTEFQTTTSYKFKLLDILTEILLVPKNASSMFRNWDMKIENGYVCLYRQNISEKLDTIKLHWDDCVNFAKKCLDQTGFIDDNCMYIFVYNSFDDPILLDFTAKENNQYELSTLDENDNMISLGLHNNEMLKWELLNTMKLGKLKIEIAKYNPENNLWWTIKYNL